MDRNQSSPVWAITSYFPLDDPAGVRRRLAAFREFRKRLQAPLVAVEFSPDGSRFDLADEDAEILLQVRGGAVLWQKERLLNLGLSVLPPSCDTVAWIDCDVVIERDDWPQAARRGAMDAGLVHLFRTLHFLDEGEEPGATPGSRESIWYDSAVAGAAGVRSPGARRTPGFAWAARRELLERHGLYDALVLGGADRAIFYAGCGQAPVVLRAGFMGARHADHYLRWADGFFQDVNRRFAFVETSAYHLWHGDLASRNYRGRYQGFQRFEFDPDVDLAPGASGAWEWGSEKSALHQWVRDYFDHRKG